jgi:lipopolysaccharide transport system ATP-binding protein
MSESIIKVNNISKQYKLGQTQPYLTLRDALSNNLKFLLNLKKKGTGPTKIWALKDIDFKVNRGELIGIIGKNGAGKSTLLKILSRITPPTTGKIVLKGKMSSLLEVGTGFHPELTGRENIFLNGAVLGMTKQEITSRFDAIVEFSGIEKFLDTPVKRYSSGMYVRLAFSVAAHLESEILLIDEVLAVGDIAFQKKCLGRMDEVAKTTGRTILFVSHNMEMIQNLCKRCILLEKGKVKMIGETEKVVEEYSKNNLKLSGVPLRDRKDREGRGDIKFTDIKITNSAGSEFIKSGDKLKIILEYTSNFKKDIKGIRVVATLFNEVGAAVLRFDSDITNETFKTIRPEGEIICETDRINLINGTYSINLALFKNRDYQDYIASAAFFEININNELYNLKTNADKSLNNVFISYSFKSR